MAFHSFGHKNLDDKSKKILAMRVGQECYISGSADSISNRINYLKNYLPDNAKFKTESREGGRLVIRIS